MVPFYFPSTFTEPPPNTYIAPKRITRSFVPFALSRPPAPFSRSLSRSWKKGRRSAPYYSSISSVLLSHHGSKTSLLNFLLTNLNTRMMNKDAILIQVTPHIERPYTITIGEAKKRLSEVNERYETFECNEEYCEYHDEVNSLTLALYGPPKEEQANNVGDIPF